MFREDALALAQPDDDEARRGWGPNEGKFGQRLCDRRCRQFGRHRLSQHTVTRQHEGCNHPGVAQETSSGKDMPRHLICFDRRSENLGHAALPGVVVQYDNQ
jgi:hypothetical protein